MKKFFSLLIGLMIFARVASAAEIESELDAAGIRLLCALSSLSAYSGDESLLAREMLSVRGWKIDALTSKNNRANVKAYLFDKNFNKRKTKILVITGTEELKDVEVDFRVGKVPLHEGAEENIFVHRGFRDYTDSALAGGLKEFLLDDLKNNPEEILYITGHSLGGAVAMMTAIRLADSGADMNRIKVITFGAPAIGNRALADAYQDKIDLTRIEISGDVIKKSLQVLGYVHFGKSVAYKEVESQTQNSHQMSIYLDSAIRNYYDLVGAENVSDFDVQNRIDTKIYVAPLRVVKKSFQPTDAKYIFPMLNDELRSRLSNLVFAEPRTVEVDNANNFSYDVTEFIEPAKAAGCEFILVQFLRAKAVKESRQRSMRVTLDEMVFDSSGALLSMQTAAPTTKELTIIEAAVFAQASLRGNREKIFSAEN